MGRKAVDSNEIFFDGMRVAAADRIGEEGQGFRYLIQSLNLNASWWRRRQSPSAATQSAAPSITQKSATCSNGP